MPMVPVASEQGVAQPRSVAPVYQSSAAATLEVFGTGRVAQAGARAVGEGADELGRLALRMQAEDNERETKTLDNALQAEHHRILYGDGTPENPGYFNTHGENALALAPKVKEELAAVRKNLTTSTKNSRVQTLFGEVAAARTEHALQLTDRHTTHQRQEANKAASMARMDLAVQGAVSGWNDPKEMQLALGVISGEVLALKEQLGLGKEQVEAMMAARKTQAVGGAVQAAIQSDRVDMAQKIFDANEKGLTAEGRLAITKALRDASVLTMGQQAADQARKMFADPVKQMEWVKANYTGKIREAAEREVHQAFNFQESVRSAGRAAANFAEEQENRKLRGASTAEYDRISAETINLPFLDRARAMRAAAEAVKDPKLRDATLARVNHGLEFEKGIITMAEHQIDVSRRRDLQKDADDLKIATQSAYAWVNGDPATGRKPGTLAEWQRLNPEKNALIAATSTGISSLQTAERMAASREQYAHVTDAGRFLQTKQLDTAKLAAVDLEEARTWAAQRDHEALTNLVTAARNRIQSAREGNTAYNAGVKAITDFLPKDSDNKIKAKDVEVNQLHNEMAAWIETYTSQGKRPTQVEINQKAVELTLNVGVSPGFHGFFVDQKMAGTFKSMTPEQLAVASVPIKELQERAPERLAEIRAHIKKAGKTETPALIEALAGALLTDNKPRWKSLLGLQ